MNFSNLNSLKSKYDYIIIGAGIYGITCAEILSSYGKSILIVDKNSHIGGNLYDFNYKGIIKQKYGAHIFHTYNYEIVNYILKFTTLLPYIHKVIAKHNGKIYSMPFNMYTFAELFDGVTLPSEAKAIIEKEKEKYGVKEPSNLEEKAISLVGKKVFDTLIKDYTEKQWNRDCKDLPSNIITRLPVRWCYDNNYFNDKYQGVPNLGFTDMLFNMLTNNNIDLILNCNFINHKHDLMNLTENIIYSGPIDELLDYRLGALEYRGLKFIDKEYNENSHQGTAVINLCDKSFDYTRTIEYKHLYGLDNLPFTIVTEEYPIDWKIGDIPYYPINDEKNKKLYNEYINLSKINYGKKFYFGGRLGSYKYYDIDDAMQSAFELCHSIIYDNKFPEQ